MSLDLAVQLSVYGHFVKESKRPSVNETASDVDASPDAVREAFNRLASRRLLVLEADGESIRMAPPFSGVPTQHVAEVEGREYFANCAWDVLGIVAALGGKGSIRSRCEHSFDPFALGVRSGALTGSAWLFHCLIPAVRWWDDIVHT